MGFLYDFFFLELNALRPLFQDTQLMKNKLNSEHKLKKKALTVTFLTKWILNFFANFGTFLKEPTAQLCEP